jgi:NADPH:quinone reductase-like Zn-dependent oxidoreductase
VRAVVLTRRGGPEALVVEERDAPRAGRGQLLVDVRAAGVNFSDLLLRIGLHPDKPALPVVLGYEVAGTVAELGPGVAGFAAGDRVAAFVPRGGYAERAAVGAGDTVRLPERMSYEQGAAVPLAYATAYAALVRYGACRAGERVLIHGAGGGMGSAATRLARRLGVEIWGTASPRKHAALERLGVDHPVDYTRPGWQDDVPPLDVVMDALGGASFRQSYRMLRAGGRLVCLGASGVLAGERRSVVAALRTVLRTPRFNPMRQVLDSKAVIGLDTIALWRERGSLRELLEPVEEMLEDGSMTPLVAAAIPFDDAATAHRLLTQRGNTGKVVLVP